MTDQELIKRLRDWEEHDEGKINDAREASADRIEELVKEKGYALERIMELDDRTEALTAKLTKAVEALRGILKGDDLYPWRIAREALAELEGK